VTPHDGPVATSRRAAARDREEAVVARLRSLGTAIDGEPDPGFRSATRARLVAMAAVRTPRPAGPPPVWRRLLAFRAEDAAPARWRGRLTAGLAAAALAVTAAATLVAVSTGARPGDVLYGLKRGTEQTQLALAGDSRGHTLLDFASTRLAELADLRDSRDAALAISTLRTMDDQSTQGAAWLTSRAVQTRSTAPVRDLAAWTGGQRADLATLAPRVPAPARDAAAGSLDLLSEIGARADALTAALSCPSGPATSGSDALGPIPAPCSSASSTNGGSTTTAPSGPAPEVGSTGTVPSPAPSGGAGGGPSGGSGTGPTDGSGTGSGGIGTLVPGTGPVVPATPSPIITVPLPRLPGTSPIGSGDSGSGDSGSGGSDSGGSDSGGSDSGGLGVCLPPLVQVGAC
jgi:hypothetical protein